MMHLSLVDAVQEVLVVGAHCDDIEIGCGGTLALLGRTRPDVRIHVCVFSGDPQRASETRDAISRLLPGHSEMRIHQYTFRDGFFPDAWPKIKEQFENLKTTCNPDLIFTHHEHDRHQDHRIVCDLTWNTFRDHVILEYEIPKWDGDLGRPTVYVPLPKDVVEHKTATLLASFPSQSTKNWFTADLFASLMRIRGMECNAESTYAEAFFARKLIGSL
jgi:LmbE family N-acetylglucosaminyl deacetylase